MIRGFWFYSVGRPLYALVCFYTSDLIGPSHGVLTCVFLCYKNDKLCQSSMRAMPSHRSVSTEHGLLKVPVPWVTASSFIDDRLREKRYGYGDEGGTIILNPERRCMEQVEQDTEAEHPLCERRFAHPGRYYLHPKPRHGYA